MVTIANRALRLVRKRLERRRYLVWHSSCSGKSMNLPMELAMQAHDSQPDPRSIPLPLRSHTIFGVCEAIGEDFGFNPVLLRAPLAAIVLYSPLIAIGAYFALGAVVLLSRLVFPQPKAVDATTAEQRAPANEQREFAKAA